MIDLKKKIEKKIEIDEILKNIKDGDASLEEEIFMKKFGKRKGLDFINLISNGNISVPDTNYKIVLYKYKNVIEGEENVYSGDGYKVEVLDENNQQLGRMKYGFDISDKCNKIDGVRMTTLVSSQNDKDFILDLLLNCCDEISKKVKAYYIYAQYPNDDEKEVYKKHNIIPFTDKPMDSHDYFYIKCKDEIENSQSNTLGIFEDDIENS